MPLDAEDRSRLTQPRLASAATILRRGLVLWGWGHVTLGDRRGWVLALLQPIFIVALVLVALQLIDGTRWLVVFIPLAVLLVVWLGQALHAYQRALRLGAAPGGEAQVALFVPLAVTLVTLYWLLGGSLGSPAATVEQYALDWMSMRADAAAPLFVGQTDPASLAATWRSETAYLQSRVERAASEYGPGSGLHPESPFDNLRFGPPIEERAGFAQVTIDIVRQQEVQTTILGLIPTASQETVTVESAGVISLQVVPQDAPEWLPVGRLSSSAWLIEDVSIGDSSAP